MSTRTGFGLTALVLLLGVWWTYKRFATLEPPAAEAPIQINRPDTPRGPRPSGPSEPEIFPDPEDSLRAPLPEEKIPVSDQLRLDASGQVQLPESVVTELKSCFGARGGLEGVSTGEELFAQLGEPVRTKERWMDWSFKIGGKERRIHWENIEDDSGRIRPALMVFDIDSNGDPIPYPLDPRDQEEPSMDIVNQLLEKAEGVQKEISHFKEYGGGIQMEFVEKDGQLREIEFEKDNVFFRCDQVGQPMTCNCFN